MNENDPPVKVVVRQRPINPTDVPETILRYEPKSKNIIIVDDRPYLFDNVFGPEISQRLLFEESIQPLVERVLQGFNCTALAYGQTGTGKSYTMGMTSDEVDEHHSGIVHRCLKLIMESKQDLYEIKISFVEIYNEKVYDLLSVNPSEPIMSKGCKYTGGTHLEVLNMTDCNEVLKRGTSKRHVRPTTMNSQSSRSHVIFTIVVTSKDAIKPFRACLNLVDLAGSEGLRRTGHTGQAMSEGVHINQGLLCIGKILQAMSEGKKMIPFRDSVLGGVLQDSLNLNSYLTLVACISAKRIDLSETLSTLRFAQRAKQLKLTPQLNSIMSELNKNKPKTPFKGNQQIARPPQTPFKRSVSEIKTSKTFCTPGKQRRTEQNHFNYTDVGLTPKEKLKVQNKLETEPKNAYQLPPPLARSSTAHSTAQRESIFEASWALNASTSTVANFEAPSCIDKPLSYSPLVEKCMEKFGSVIENKMQKFMESFINVNLRTPAQQSVRDDTSRMRSEIKSLLSEMMTEKKPSNSAAANQFGICSSTPAVNAKCQLFTTSSPVFKVPEIPALSNQYTSAVDISKNQTVDQSFDYSMTENTVRPARRSMRLLNKTVENQQINSSAINSSKNVRRSLRLQQTIVCDETQMEFSKETKRRRTGIELQISNNTNLENSVKIINPTTKAKNSKKSNNPIYEKLFSTCSHASSNSSDKFSKSNNVAKYRKAILELLNNGTMQELQMLPQIGLKTAYQIVTHRTLNGKFKNLAQVEKLPIWRGKAWERFAQANMLT